MKRTAFLKALSANDVGATGAHQAGILVPKSNTELLAFLPHLDANIKNPSTWIDCIDEDGATRRLRYVYYNNSLHDVRGTRDEYRITRMTAYFRALGAREGDALEISLQANDHRYHLRLVRQKTTAAIATTDDSDGVRIRIKQGWNRVH